jgi:hypothetical protein
MGYMREREYIWNNHGIRVETCHVAHVKESLGLTRGHSWNRIDPQRRVKSCPKKFRPIIEEAVRYVHRI